MYIRDPFAHKQWSREERPMGVLKVGSRLLGQEILNPKCLKDGLQLGLQVPGEHVQLALQICCPEGEHSRKSAGGLWVGCMDLAWSKGKGLIPASGIPGAALAPAILLWVQWATLVGFT